MTQQDVLQQVQQVIREELDNDDVAVTPETVADDIEDWDSLTNIQIMMALQKKFGVKFTALQINGFKNVGEICNCILSTKA